jgi:hypothetical protein
VVNPENLFIEFEAFLDQALELNVESSHTEFIIESDFYTLVPSGLFNLHELLTTLEFQHQSLPENGYTLQVNELKGPSIQLAFIMNTAIYKAITNKFDNCQLTHHLTPLIKETIGLSSALTVYVRNTQIDIIWTQNNNLLYCNSHHYGSDEDILYHILNLKGGLGVDTDTIPVVINTDKTKQTLENLLRTHISKIEFKTIPR